ncbi:endonuclease/exonuclease/phosphatase family protein [Treponema ruminis]|nr:endonuclease/exonuclease/phosphatase family protein [Treponema ruminis]
MKRMNFMMPFLRPGRACLAMLALVCLLSCSSSFSDSAKDSDRKSLRIMNWNLQTFFDSTFDGNEYTDFKSKKSGWSQEKYEERLDRLASVIKELDADLVIMEEIEKEAQIQDIANRLSGTFDFSKAYTHAVFSGSPDSSIGCALLSRYPLEEISVHAMDIRDGQKQPAMRPIFQCRVKTKDKNLVLFVNHWKSKSGGAEESEIWRKRQESLLADLIFRAEKQGNAVLAAGDFNKDISEFDYHQGKSGRTNILLHGRKHVEVYSPWILENGTYRIPGSYWYKEKWERIDHFFAAGNAEITDFAAENSGDWADSDGHPFRYQIWNGRGYSDHLPITCTVSF